MRLVLAAVALLTASPAVAASEDYICKNHGKAYPVSLDRDAGTFVVDRKPAKVEHLAWASQVVDIKGTVTPGNMTFHAELNNIPSIEYMSAHKVVRVDQCKYVDKPLE